MNGNMLTRDGWTQVWNGENRLIETSKGNVKLQQARRRHVEQRRVLHQPILRVQGAQHPDGGEIRLERPRPQSESVSGKVFPATGGALFHAKPSHRRRVAESAALAAPLRLEIPHRNVNIFIGGSGGTKP